MEWRNPVRLDNGWIDCEINHPVYGWIPFTCDPDDKGALFDTAALHNAMLPYAGKREEISDAAIPQVET
jgi:hypothetical protein